MGYYTESSQRFQEESSASSLDMKQLGHGELNCLQSP